MAKGIKYLIVLRVSYDRTDKIKYRQVPIHTPPVLGQTKCGACLRLRVQFNFVDPRLRFHHSLCTRPVRSFRSLFLCLPSSSFRLCLPFSFFSRHLLRPPILRP